MRLSGTKMLSGVCKVPQLSVYLDELIARLALDEDRRIDARVVAGLEAEAVRKTLANEQQVLPPRRHGPVAHQVPNDVREYVIPDFRAGIDSCCVDVWSSKIEVMHWQGPGGAVVCIDDGREQLVVAFLGLSAPPFDDLTISYPSSRHSKEVTFEARALSATDIARDTTIATPFAAPSGEGPLAEFWAFDARREVVEIMRSPDAADQASVTVAPTSDGRDAMVTIDGQAAAILRGAPFASRRNVRIVTSTDI